MNIVQILGFAVNNHTIGLVGIISNILLNNIGTAVSNQQRWEKKYRGHQHTSSG